jgi:chemotaxis protein MotB
MKRRKNAGHTNHERWLVSYADFITLLFAFFVVLYASAQVDKRKVGKLSEAIEDGFQQMGSFSSAGKRATPIGGVRPAGKNTPEIKGSTITPDRQEIERLQREIERSLAEEIRRGALSTHIGPDGLVLSLREVGFFNSGSAQMRPEAQESFSRIVKVLGERPYRLRVEGHTDNVPIHNDHFVSNWELSTSRATEVVRLLLAQEGFRPENLAAAGYAEFHPEGDNATDEGRQMNRRVDVVVLTTAVRQEKTQ